MRTSASFVNGYDLTDAKGVEDFNKFMQRYTACLPVEKAACKCMKEKL